ncbi:elongator complex protein 3 [Wukongibacter sp. M2B1]|uniref:elongator complex protein 3 n=1 Tax=Wukongibacter sp. M2B1 TaxID=3088895 RepID=UPI003D7A22A2
MSKKNYIIPVFVPHHGCPFDCIFCNQKKITGIDTVLTGNQIEEQIKEYAQSIGKKENKHIEIAFFGGSFTGIDREKQKEFLAIANKWYQKGYLDDIRLSTRPDYINEDILSYLKEYNVSIIELGVQSLDDEVLKKSHRGHSIDDVYRASELIKKMDFKLGLQMMVGLPGDDFEKSMLTAQKIISYKPDFVRIYPTLVIRGTKLEELLLKGIYKPLGLDEAVAICKELYKLFYKNEIPIIRIGLQPTENIMSGKDVVAGPFHPSFRQLVECEIYKEAIDESISLYNGKLEKLEFILNPKSISNLVGMKKSNILFLKTKYDISNIEITKDLKLSKKQLKIRINDSEAINRTIL